MLGYLLKKPDFGAVSGGCWFAGESFFLCWRETVLVRGLGIGLVLKVNRCVTWMQQLCIFMCITHEVFSACMLVFLWLPRAYIYGMLLMYGGLNKTDVQPAKSGKRKQTWPKQQLSSREAPLRRGFRRCVECGSGPGTAGAGCRCETISDSGKNVWFKHRFYIFGHKQQVDLACCDHHVKLVRLQCSDLTKRRPGPHLFPSL